MKNKLLSRITGVAAALLIIGSVAELSAQDYYYRRQDLFYQPVRLGLGADQYVTGNWHGTFYNPYFSISKGKNSFAAGPVIQKRSMSLRGGKISYSRTLTGGDHEVDCDGQLVDGFFQMNAFCSLQYIDNTGLSYSSVIIEERSNRKRDMDWREVKLSTAEICAGVEVHLKISRQLTWKNYFGACVYNHITYIQGMYHEKMAPVLVLGTGITFKK